MKKTLLLAALFCCTSFCRAEEINALVLHLASGQEVTCLLDNQPVVTFSGEDLVIKSHMSTITYSSADVLKFTYSYVDPSAVNGHWICSTEVESIRCLLLLAMDYRQ